MNDPRRNKAPHGQWVKLMVKLCRDDPTAQASIQHQP